MVGFEQVSGTTVKTLTAAKYTGAKQATISVETNAIRFTVDGTTPTTSVGFPIAVGESFELETPEEIRGFQFIAQTGTAQIDVAYSNTDRGFTTPEVA